MPDSLDRVTAPAPTPAPAPEPQAAPATPEATVKPAPAKTTSAATEAARTDTAAVKAPVKKIVNPFEARTCHADQAPRPATTERTLRFTTGRVPSSYGLPGEPRPLLPGYDTGVMCLLIGTFLILAANFRHYSTFLKNFAQDLWSVRNRSNIFDDHTMSETRVMASFIMVLCLSEGIIVFSAIARSYHNLPIFSSVAVITALAMAFYLAQNVVYRLVGYTFTTSENTLQWVRGFKASQSLLGITLVIPALVVLFNPGLSTAVTLIALALYVTARIIFVLKGFRIFYINSFSLIYFILYLCTLEIIPPVLLCKAALSLTLLF